ncbi:MAG: hypothetical protein ACRC37_00540 [Lentisphaeria bacterium]
MNSLENYNAGLEEFFKINSAENFSNCDLSRLTNRFDFLWNCREHFANDFNVNGTLENNFSYEFLLNKCINDDVMKQIVKQCLAQAKIDATAFEKRYLELANKNIFFEVLYWQSADFCSEFLECKGNKVSVVRASWIQNEYFKYLALHSSGQLKEGDVIETFPF